MKRYGGPSIASALLAAALATRSLVACAPPRPAEFKSAAAAAQRAYAHGRYEEAADQWQRAAASADSSRDHDEAVYRAARSLDRARRPDAARELLDALALSSPDSGKAARASYEVALLDLRRGQAERGHEGLAGLVKSASRTPIAPMALRRLLDHLSSAHGEAARLKFIASARRTAKAPAIAERLTYEHGRALEARGDSRAAHDIYLESARRFPYPSGALWDDALWRAALIDDATGNPAEARRHLEAMLGEREPASFNGSYERGRYAEARYKLAELLRDRDHDSVGAAREFRRLWQEHSTSRLRDDALWQAALLEATSGRGDAACRDAELLVEEAPTSRYAGCVALICPKLAARAPAPCRDYIARSIKH